MINKEKVIQELNQFAKDRDWEKFHTIKNLCISLSIEASELNELIQWDDLTADEIKSNKKLLKKFEDELADIYNYLLMISQKLEIDLDQVAIEKILINEKKYPIAKSKGSSKKYTMLK